VMPISNDATVKYNECGLGAVFSYDRLRLKHRAVNSIILFLWIFFLFSLLLSDRLVLKLWTVAISSSRVGQDVSLAFTPGASCVGGGEILNVWPCSISFFLFNCGTNRCVWFILQIMQLKSEIKF